MQALEKLTLAYLELLAKHDDLVKQNEELVTNISELNHKYKTTKEQKAFLQTERNKWFDAYNQIVETNEKATVEQADEMRNLKYENAELLRRLQFNSKFQNSIEKESSAQNEQIHNLKQCIEELESQLVALTPKEQQIDEPTDGLPSDVVMVLQYGKQWLCGEYGKDFCFDYSDNIKNALQFASRDEINDFLCGEPLGNLVIHYFNPQTGYIGTTPPDGYDDAKRVCRADFKASETTEKADEAIQPVILLANQYGTWVKSCFFIFDDRAKIKQFMFTTEIKEAKQFASLVAVGEFLSGCVGEKLQTSYHHPETLQLLPTEI